MLRSRHVGRLGLITALGLVAAPLSALPAAAVPGDDSTVFINEFHYDNASTDVGEFVEVAAPAGTDLSTYSIVLYNGNNSAVYDTDALSGVVTDQSNGYGTVALTYPSNGIQNGSPDGIALVNGETLVQFLSYEGTITAVDGPAAGQESTDVSVAEAGSEPIGQSLQLTGTGGTYGDFTWTGPAAESPGAVNAGQTFATPDNAPVVTECAAGVTTDAGTAAGASLSASDADGSVVGAQITSTDVPGISVTDVVPSSASGEPLTATLAVDGTTPAGDYDVVVQFSNDDAEPQTNTCTVNVVVNVPTGSCGDEATLVSTIQGSGATTTMSGETVVVEAVVTAVKDGLRGFYVQEEAADSDGDPTTSEGVFVYTGSADNSDVEVGQLVRIRATVDEYETSGSSQTQLTDPQVVDCGVASEPVEPTAVTFPLDDADDLENVEGMLVVLTDELVISEYFNYARFGEVVLAKPLDGLDRLYTPTAVVEPGDEARALAEEYERRIITLDDSRSVQNPGEIPHPGNGEPFSLENSFRGGDTITGVEGVIDETFGLYRIQPTEYGDYEAVNPRPTDAPDVGGDIQVASFNVLNYFLTLDDGVNDVCGGLQNLECRGADNAEELERQRAKIIAALVELDADVIGLLEMENTPGVDPAADLAAGLNEILGEGTYASIDTGVVGTDAIRNGILYKPGVVEPVGDFAVLDSSVDPRFLDDKNRPMITQTFDEVATGERFTVSVNHLKSKGSSCADVGDPDTGDGSANCNLTRVAAAEAIADFLAGDPTGSGDPDHLVIGDLNSYDKEDPIDVLVAAGYTDLIAEFGGEYAYGYVFDGQVGYLDYALSSESLTSQVTGAAEWHINADEPNILDYDTSFKPDSVDALYAPDPYRSSDHDAVLVGLNLGDGSVDPVDPVEPPKPVKPVKPVNPGPPANPGPPFDPPGPPANPGPPFDPPGPPAHPGPPAR